MPANEAGSIHLTERERRNLQTLVRQQTCPQHLALRARIVLLADEGIGIRPTAERLGVVRTTRKIRCSANPPQLATAFREWPREFSKSLQYPTDIPGLWQAAGT